MSMMRNTILFMTALLLWGCYDAQDGSNIDPYSASLSGDAKTGYPCNGETTSAEVWANGTIGVIDRSSDCIDGVASVVETVRPEEEDPRPEMLWSDCDALDDGRSGEACEGTFACYREDGENCIEKIACQGEEGASKLVRMSYCDIVGYSTPTGDRSSANCDEAATALPLERCTGPFLCETLLWDTPTYEPVPLCDDGNEAYCFADADADNTAYGLIWCDGEVIHIISDDSRELVEIYEL